MSELISLSEYGRRRGVSEGSVRKAIKAGKIVKGVIHGEGKRPKINPEIADTEWMQNHTARNQSAALEGQFYDQGVGSGKENQSVPGFEGQRREEDPVMMKSRKAKAVYEAKMAELKYKQMDGTLVNKKEVYQSLFNAGKEIRDALLIIPDRIVDSVMSAPDRHTAHQIINSSILKVLEKLTTIQIQH